MLAPPASHPSAISNRSSEELTDFRGDYFAYSLSAGWPSRPHRIRKRRCSALQQGWEGATPLGDHQTPGGSGLRGSHLHDEVVVGWKIHDARRGSLECHRQAPSTLPSPAPLNGTGNPVWVGYLQAAVCTLRCARCRSHALLPP